MLIKQSSRETHNKFVNSDKFKARLFVVAAPLYHKNPHFKFAGYKGVRPLNMIPTLIEIIEMSLMFRKCILFFVLFASSHGAISSGTEEPVTDEQKVSYGFGLQFGQQLLKNDFEGLDIDHVLKGINDVYKDDKIRVTKQELNEAYQNVRPKSKLGK